MKGALAVPRELPRWDLSPVVYLRGPGRLNRETMDLNGTGERGYREKSPCLSRSHLKKLAGPGSP